MSQHFEAQLPVAVTLDGQLSKRYEQVSLPMYRLEQTLSLFDHEQDRNALHIHITDSREEYQEEHITAGECLRPASLEQDEAQRVKEIQSHLGESDRDVSNTTFIVINLRAICVLSIVKLWELSNKKHHLLISKEVDDDPLPDMKAVESEMCLSATETLIHEICHARISTEEHEGRFGNSLDDEEEYVLAQTASIMDSGLAPQRVINVRLRQDRAIWQYVQDYAPDRDGSIATSR